MSNRSFVTALVGAAAVSVAAAAEPSAQTATPPSHTAAGAPCAQVQPAVENIIAAATLRLESARQSNDAAQMRAAVDQAAGALRDIGTQLASCAIAAAAGDPHAGHAMPTAAPAAPPPAQAPADAHAGHQMPATKAPAPAAPKSSSAGAPARSKPAADPHAGHTMPAKAPSKAAAPKAATPKAAGVAADPHAGHAVVAAEPGKERDPVNGLMVDPASAPKTTYQGRTYYFSSEQSLKQFLENPAKFTKSPKK